MKTTNIWMAVVGMVVVAGCAAVDEDPSGPTETAAPQSVMSGPADSMVQQTTDAGPERDESPTVDSEVAPSAPSDAADTDEDAADERPSENTDDSSTAADDSAECTPQECGPGLLAPNVFCGDGSIGGPVCERDDSGTCGWSIRECPDGCTLDACGPQTLRAANILCADGSMGGPVCGLDNSRTCGWFYRACPEECPEDKCGYRPDYLQICDDGTELHPVCTVDQSASVDAPNCSWTLPTCE